MTRFDYQQFHDSVKESKESISTFLDLGIELPKLNTIDFMNFYSRMINESDKEHFGVFHGYKMLAYACFCPAFDDSGIQIVYWVREAYLRQNIGTWTIGKMTSKSWVEYEYHFSQLVIDKANYASRRIAKAMGYFPLYAITVRGQGTKSSDSFIIYIHLNPSLRMKAAVYEKRPIDLIGHICFIEEFSHLIHDEKVNEFFKWKYPIYVEDDIDIDGSFKGWKPETDPADPSNRLFENLAGFSDPAKF